MVQITKFPLQTVSGILPKPKCHLWFLVFLLQTTFSFRNVDVETCVQEKVGKRKGVLVKTWITTAKTSVTVARKLMTKSWKCGKIEW